MFIKKKLVKYILNGVRTTLRTGRQEVFNVELKELSKMCQLGKSHVQKVI